MFGYKKKPITAQGKTISLLFDEFRVHAEGSKNTLYAADSLNCDCRDGSLRTGLGAREYALKSGVKPNFTLLSSAVDGIFVIDNIGTLAAAVSTEKLCVTTEDEKLWVFIDASGQFTGGALLGSNVCAATAVDKTADKTQTIFVGDPRAFYVQDNGVEGIALSNTVPAVCEFNNRLFVGSKVFKIVYSSPDKAFTFTPDSTDEQGTLNLPLDRGDVVALLRYEDGIYVFCQRGIFRLYAAGSARDFKLTALEYAGGGIFGRSVGRCGRSIFFLAQDGLYRIYGDSVKRICQHLPIRPRPTKQVCNHAAVGGDYVLRYIDTASRKRTVVVDSEGKDGYFISNYEGLSEYHGKPFCRYNDTLGTLADIGGLPTGEKYYFHSQKLDFGTAEKVTLKSLRLEGLGGFICEIIADGKVYSKKLGFSNGTAEWKKQIRAKEFYLRFTLSNGTVIRSVAVEAVAP